MQDLSERVAGKWGGFGLAEIELLTFKDVAFYFHCVSEGFPY